MSYKSLKELVQYLRNLAEEKRMVSAVMKSDYLSGLDRGYADAYDLCAKWVEEIMEGRA